MMMIFHKLSHSHVFRHHRVIFREFAVSTLPSYTCMLNATVGNIIYNWDVSHMFYASSLNSISSCYYQCIRQKTGAQTIVKEIKQYQKKWLQHVQRMDTNRQPKQALQYKPKGRRNIGWLRKRWRDQLHLEDQGTGNTPNPSGTMMMMMMMMISHKQVIKKKNTMYARRA